MVLALTVILFSSTFYWIGSIPTPASKTRTDLSSTLEQESTVYWLNITHRGGQTLKDWNTMLYVQFPQNSTTVTLQLSDSQAYVGGDWTIGKIFVWMFVSGSAVESVLVTVIGLERSEIVWQDSVPLRVRTAPYVSDFGTDPGPVITFQDFIAYARIGDPDNDIDPDNVLINLSSLGSLPANAKMTYNIITDRFETSSYTTAVADGVYPATITVRDLAGHQTVTQVQIFVSLENVEGKPDLTVLFPDTDITFSNDNPTRDDTVTISATISNLGSVAAERANVSFYDGAKHIYTKYGVSVPGSGQISVYSDWVASPGGLHTIYINITGVYPDESNVGNNIRGRQITVMPTILLVDDDAAADGSHDDVVSYMESSLQSCDFRYTLHTVGSAADGPPANGSDPGKHPLKNYDIVIWMTGNASTFTLKPNDQDSIKSFLNAHGSLWLIGQDILNELGAGNSLVTSYLHVNSFSSSTQPSGWVFGTNNNSMGPITGDVQPIETGGTTDRIPKRGDYISSMTGASTRRLFNNSLNLTLGISYNSTYRLVFFPWEFSEMTDMGMQAVVTYKMITWLGNVSWRSGNDVAVSSQRYSPTNPHYMEEVNITTVVRNNGQFDLTDVKVVFRVDNVAIPMAPDGKPNPQTISLRKNGGMAWLYKKWLPRVVGEHTVTVEINPDRTNPPSESNYDNNMLTGMLSASAIYVEYKVLIVDDDASMRDSKGAIENPGGVAANPDVADYVKYSLDDCGLKGSYDEFNVALNGNGPTRSRMSNYTTIVWATGNTTSNTIRQNDMAELTAFLKDNMTSLWLIGYGILNDTTVKSNATFLRNILRVNSMSSVVKTLNPIYGVMNDEVTHGMKISVTSRFGPAYGVVPFIPVSDINTDPVFLRGATSYYNTTADYMGVKYSSPQGWREFFMPWEFSGITGGSLFETQSSPGGAVQPMSGGGGGETGGNGESPVCARGDLPVAAASAPQINATQQRDELAYGIMHWFGRIESRPELRTTPPDMFYGNVTSSNIQFNLIHPVIGESFVLKAKIWNLGGSSAGAIVRFLDGDTEIQSANVYIPPSETDVYGNVVNGYTIAEVIWRPLFAGLETIRVVVDPEGLVPNERFRFNNEARHGTYVYFFYDDMENGDSHWKHESVVTRINGESPIEYFDPPANTVKTNVEWDWQAISGFKKNATDFHTFPYCFSMFEPRKTGPVDLVIAFDTSNSMSGTPLANEKAAALALMGMLTDDSRLAVTEYAGGGNIKWDPTSGSTPQMWTMDSAGRAAATTAINGKTANAVTQVWDNIGVSFSSLRTLNAPMPTHTPVVVALTDGCDRNGNDIVMIQPNDNALEKGSDKYAPWDVWTGSESYTYASRFGKYGGDSTGTEGYWDTATFSGGSQSRDGLLSLPIRVFTIGLNLEHNSPEDQPSTATKPTEDVWGDTNTLWTGGKESGTVEYSLWRISTTSNATYFYAPTSADLIKIFTDIGTIIGGMQQKSVPSPPSLSRGGNGICAIQKNKTYPSNADGDNYTLTKTFSLPFTLSGARLSYFQKYNLVAGANGLVIMVGTSADSGTTFKYRYVSPMRLYPGNLNTQYKVYDWNGNGGVNDHVVEWAFNGKSGHGEYTWEQVEVDLTPFIGNSYVRVLFQYFFLGGGNNGTFMLDDIEIITIRRSSYSLPLSTTDQWQYMANDSAGAHGGKGYWRNHDPLNSNWLGSGIDSGLLTQPIDLTNAKNPTLSAYFRFNIFWGINGAGRPPDGFRVEVSQDNGASWKSLSLGIRSSWNVSGAENSHDGVVDGRSYTGITAPGDKQYWVEAATLYRLETNLTGWRGSVILMRFRVVTCTDMQHFSNGAVDGGIYLDDVKVTGDTIIHG
jgi:hypothetical protein